MKIVYIDESGYTGADLLNKDQPFQGASAICISEEEAKDLIEQYFPARKTAELKYGALTRRKSNWSALLGLQKDLLNNHECISYVCDKRFLLILHFLNYAVEPYYFDRNIDFYEDGQNYSMASLLYYAGDTLLKDNCFRDILILFQNAMKLKTKEAIYDLTQKIKGSPWQEFPEAFGPLAMDSVSCINAIISEGASTDGAYVVLLSLISRLETIMPDEYEITHDESKNLEQYDITLNKMIHHQSSVSFRETKLTKLKFPMKLKGVSRIDSKDSPSVQLADILIGGVMDSAKAITGIKKNQYNSSIANLYRDNQLIHLLPDLDFDQQKEFRKGSQGCDVIDYFSRNFS